MIYKKVKNRNFSQFLNITQSTAFVLILCLGPAGSVGAQEEMDESTELEEVVITGTRKKGQLVTETLSPVDMIRHCAGLPGSS